MLLEIKNGVYPKIGNGSTPLKTASAECAPARTAEYDLRQTLCCHQKQPDPARSATNRYCIHQQQPPPRAQNPPHPLAVNPPPPKTASAVTAPPPKCLHPTNSATGHQERDVHRRNDTMCSVTPPTKERRPFLALILA